MTFTEKNSDKFRKQKGITMNSFVFHEPKPHGTPDFPFEYFYIEKSHPRYHMSFHWHKEWEIIHVIKGVFTAYIDDVMFTVRPGDSLLVQGGMLHGGISDNCVYECFLFDLHGLYRNLDTVKPYLRPVYRKFILPDIYFPAGENTSIGYAISQLSEFCQRNELGKDVQVPLELIVYSSISQLFSVILTDKLYIPNQTNTAENTHKIDQLKAVLEYIEQNYASPLTLSDLASVANMNPSYFCRFFRSITHQSPMDYVNMYRIEKVAQLLHHSNQPTVDICMECGFNEYSNFIKVFKKYKGMTPKKYRES